jgi:hypothetical protein
MLQDREGLRGLRREVGLGAAEPGKGKHESKQEAWAKPKHTSDEFGRGNRPPRRPALRLSARSCGYALAALRHHHPAIHM